MATPTAIKNSCLRRVPSIMSLYSSRKSEPSKLLSDCWCCSGDKKWKQFCSHDLNWDSVVSIETRQTVFTTPTTIKHSLLAPCANGVVAKRVSSLFETSNWDNDSQLKVSDDSPLPEGTKANNLWQHQQQSNTVACAVCHLLCCYTAPGKVSRQSYCQIVGVVVLVIKNENSFALMISSIEIQLFQ